MRRIGWLLVALLALTGCFNVDVVAPHGTEVYLVSTNVSTQVRRQWRTWYGIYGAVPVTDTLPDQIIQREGLTDVRIIVQDNIPDGGIGFFYTILVPIGLVPQTIVIEGNRPPAVVSAPVSK